MKIKEELIGDILHVVIEEKDANLVVSDAFKALMIERINSGNKNLIVSFKQVDYVDSSFLGALVSILKRVLPIGGKIVLTEINADISSLFELTRLDKVFHLEKSLSQALKQFEN